MASAEPVIDHDRIRQWAEERRGIPARVRGTGVLRIDFPGYSGEDTLEAIEWDDWFRTFDENNLALLLQERTADGEISTFNKLVNRDSVSDQLGEKTRARGAGSNR